MKKWLTATLLALLMLLLLGAAHAEDGHNWQWEQGETTHIRYCDGCTAYNHTDIVYDSTSHGHHAYICKWPKTEPQNQNGFIEIGLACNLCSKPQRAKAQMRSDTVPTCSRTGSHTYEYADSYATAKYDSETEHTYTVPTVAHQFDEYTPNYDATCTQNGTKTAKCRYSWDGCTAMDTREIPNSMLRHDIQQHAAKAPTCTEIGWNAYETCSRCDYTTYTEISASGHNCTVTTTKPTCTKGGYTTHLCTLCKDTYVDQRTAARGHWYGEWTPDADADTHTAACRRRGCSHQATTACASLAGKVIAEDQTANEFTLCPVCGKVSDGSRLALIEQVSADMRRFPHGELLVRMGQLADGNQLMLVGFESAGELTQAKYPLTLSLPAGLLSGCILRLLAADGTETALPFTVNGETACFTLDFTGAESPVLLIRILPAQ